MALLILLRGLNLETCISEDGFIIIWEIDNKEGFIIISNSFGTEIM